jgi:hypothetical protein
MSIHCKMQEIGMYLICMKEIQSVLGASARLLQGRVDVLQLCSRAESRGRESEI